MENNGAPITNTKTTNYDSNPVTNAVSGLVIVLKNNPVTILLLPILYYFALTMVVSSLAIFILIGAIAKSPIIIALLVIISIVILGLVIALFTASFFMTAVKSAKNEKTEVGDVLRISFKRLLPYWGLTILYGLAIFFGLLLFIIPGIIIAGRGSLASLVFFEENLGPVDSLKRSFALTKGHVIEMLGTSAASALLTGGGMGLLIGATSVGPYLGRYKDLTALQASGAAKPKIHWMNYLIVFGGILYVILSIIYVVAAIALDSSSTSSTTTTLISQIKHLV